VLAVYAEWLNALEQSGLGHLARHSAWAYTVSNLLHVLGAALLVGGIATFDLKILLGDGWGAGPVARVAIPLAAAGLALQLPTGLMLLAPEASKLGVNPAFYAKMAFIAVGVVNLALLHARFGSAMRGGDLGPGLRPFAAISLVAWVLTLLAGRMIAYL
jgi:hypothetical protein